MQPNHYTDPAQFALPLERWHQERKHWDACEASRLNALKEHISGGGIYKGFIGFCSVVLIGVAWYTGATYGAGAGWTLLVGGGVVLGGVMEGAENFERWRRKKDLDWRFFPNPQPVYIGPAPQQEAPPPPPRWEPPPAAPEPGKVTTLPAIEILGLPPQTTKSECKRAYRLLMAQYHPDKVAHLAPEFRKMAAEKSLQLNLAMQFIESYLR